MTWIARTRLGLLIVMAVVLQTTLFSSGLRVFDVTPDLLLVLTIACAYYMGPERGAAFGFIAGLAIDLFLSTPMGLSALSFALVGYAVAVIRSGLVHASRWVAPLMGGLGGLAGGALFVCVGALAGQDHLLALRSVQVVLVASVYDGVLALAAFPLARWATRDQRPQTRDLLGNPLIRE
jgi:rod shape-determining protein MreD